MRVGILALVAVLISGHAEAYENVNGGALAKCSGPGMALTGFTRSGSCVDQNDDAGSHHICIDLSSTSGGNFCTVTGQPNWCSSSMACDGDTSKTCPVEHWCVCQWAFSSYIENAGGCDKIQDVVCSATNMQALKAYEAQAPGSSKIANALACLKQKCSISAGKGSVGTSSNGQTNEKSDGYEGSVRDNVHQESSETPPTAVSPAIIAGGIAGVAAVATIAFIATKGWKARSLAKDVEFEEFADEEQQ